jgi:hypothetical protein
MADLILNNKLSVANQIEVSLTESKVRDYYWEKLYNSRQKKYKERLKGENFHHTLAQKVMNESVRLFGIDPCYVHKWKINYAFVENKRFTTFRIEDPDINRNFRLQEKYLYNKDCLQEYEEIELAVNSCAYPYVKENENETTWLIDLSEDDFEECSELLSYEVEYAINLTYYDALYYKIPVEFSGIVLPKRLDNLNLGQDLHKKLFQFQRCFPVTLTDSVLTKYEKMIPKQATVEERLYFFNLLKEFSKKAEENEWLIEIIDGKVQAKTLKIPEEESVESDDLDEDIYALALSRRNPDTRDINELQIPKLNIGGLSAKYYMQMNDAESSSDSEQDTASFISEMDLDEFEEDYLDFG